MCCTASMGDCFFLFTINFNVNIILIIIILLLSLLYWKSVSLSENHILVFYESFMILNVHIPLSFNISAPKCQTDCPGTAFPQRYSDVCLNCLDESTCGGWGGKGVSDMGRGRGVFIIIIIILNKICIESKSPSCYPPFHNVLHRNLLCVTLLLTINFLLYPSRSCLLLLVFCLFGVSDYSVRD